MIYVIGEHSTGVVKIGLAANPHQRLPSLQTGNAVKLSVQAVLPGEREHERHLHRRFAHLKTHGEWFDFGDNNAVQDVVTEWIELYSQPAEILRTQLMSKGPRYKTPLDDNGDPLVFVGRDGDWDLFVNKDTFES